MKLKYNDLTIREATQNDADYLHKYWNDGGWDISIDRVREMLEQGQKAGTPQHMIELSGRLIGDIHYGADKDGADIGIYIRDNNEKGKGYGTLAMTMLIDSLFKYYGYEKILINTSINNGSMRHIAEKKFDLTPVVHENVLQEQSGTYESYVEYGFTKENWKNEIAYEFIGEC